MKVSGSEHYYWQSGNILFLCQIIAYPNGRAV